MTAGLVGVIVLAAGASTRLGQPKQSLPYGDSTLLAHAVAAALNARLGPVLVVLGAHGPELAQALPSGAVAVHNPDWQEGMASSIRAGLAALERGWPQAAAAIVMVCDQPSVSAGLLRRLVAAWRQGSAAAVACQYGDTVGVPALFSRSLWPELMALRGDRGAKSVLERHRERLLLVPFPEGALDIDTPEDWQRLQRQRPAAAPPGP
ncbi:MAG: nucleotidyltransferase family protein [Chloroflexota bacterium]|nr:nucleotidyltransferase family protein [Chloroflexota bacterium]